jgi:inhibitor of cysteine peptidase
MKTKLILLATMAVIVLGLGACSSTEEQLPPKQASVEVSIDGFMNVNAISREVEVAKGGTVTVILGSNQTTGFQWSEQAQINNTAILEQTSHKYVNPEAGSGTQTVGAAGKEEWTFRALQSGTTTVAMEYSRPWEGGEKGVWAFTLTVKVQP